VHDVCTHEFALLSKGYQEGSVVECPLHQARFDVVTGACLSPPAKLDVRTYPVRIVAGEVLVAIDAGQVPQTGRV
jgi:nitrite reductase/ring-hydroxylating ferredoxin subunit